MKKFALCILILSLVSIVPIANTQVKSEKKYAIILHIDDKDYQSILNQIVEMTSHKMTQKGIKPNITTGFNDKWDRAVVITPYFIKQESVFILQKYLRLPNKFIHPEVQDIYINIPVGLLLEHNLDIMIWEDKDLLNTCRRMADSISDFFLKVEE